MESFTFYNPVKMIYGEGKIPSIAGEISAAGIKKVLLVAGGGSIRNNGVYQQVTQSLIDNHIEWVENWGVKPNPDLAKVREIIDFARKEDVKAILAVGGGSVIDASKAVAAGAVYLGDVWELFELRNEITHALPLYTVLTLSATGTEMDEFAVVTNEGELKKWGIFGDGLFPKASVVDPSVQAGLSWYQTVNGAIDAISHVMEQYFSGKRANTTMSLAESLIRSVIDATDRLQVDPNDYDARSDLAWAASLALNGIIRTGTGDGDWASHSIEHGISAVKTEISHGAGLGVVFPAWIKYIGRDDEEAFSRWAKNVWGCDSVDEAVEAYRSKLKHWGHPTTLHELEVDESEIDAIVASIMQAPVGRIKELDEQDIREILALAAG